MLDKACFCLRPECLAIEGLGVRMEQMTFRELTDKMMLMYTERKYVDALQLVEQNADHFPEQSARTTFWKMCLLSLAGRSEEVISVFQKGLDAGLWWAGGQFVDPDLDAVRYLPEFQRLVSVSQAKYEEARKYIKRDPAVLVPEAPASGLYPLLIALHGRNGNKAAHLEFWEAARQRGWLVVSPQSTQPLFDGAYCWDDSALGLADVLSSYAQVSQKYQIDPQRMLIAGFSQGSGMAIYTALSGNVKVRGFIGIASFWDKPDSLVPQSEAARWVRGYFVIGEKDHTLENAKEVKNVLKEHGVQFTEELHPDLAHEFPADFGSSFEKAINFIFKERE
jgi:predicted esterase